MSEAEEYYHEELVEALENMSGWARIFLKQLRDIDGKPRGGLSFHEEYKEARAILKRINQ